MESQIVGMSSSLVIIGLIVILFLCQRKQKQMMERNETFLDAQETIQTLAYGSATTAFIFILLLIILFFIFPAPFLAVLAFFAGIFYGKK